VRARGEKETDDFAGALKQVRRESVMNPRFYSRLAAIIFAVIAIVQLLRVFFAWEVTLNGVAIPLFVSGVACFFAAAMAWLVFSAWRT
jgi:hypothetical protein